MKNEDFLAYINKFDLEKNENELNVIRVAFELGLTYEQIELFAKPEFNYEQMLQIRAGFLHGLSIDEVKSFADSNITAGQMRKKRKELEKKLKKSSLRLTIDSVKKSLPLLIILPNIIIPIGLFTFQRISISLFIPLVIMWFLSMLAFIYIFYRAALKKDIAETLTLEKVKEQLKRLEKIKDDGKRNYKGELSTFNERMQFLIRSFESKEHKILNECKEHLIDRENIFKKEVGSINERLASLEKQVKLLTDYSTGYIGKKLDVNDLVNQFNILIKNHGEQKENIEKLNKKIDMLNNDVNYYKKQRDLGEVSEDE